MKARQNEPDKTTCILRNLRGGSSISEVAAAIGIPTASLTAYEEGKRIPRDEVKVSISRHYGVPVDRIFAL